MSISVKEFGVTPEGRVIKAFTLSNANGIEATVIERGATLISVMVPDKNGKKEDVVLGFDNLEQYLENEPFFGATVGRSANRVAGAKVEIGGKTYDLDVNDGPNNLHTSFKNGFHKRDWEAQAEENNNAVVFFIEEEDGATGFPGKLNVTVTYRLTEENELLIAYHAVTDKETISNCTNHAYFNLAGHSAGNVKDQIIRINASRYIPVVKGAIPTGEWADVEGTPFDLRKDIRIGEHVDDDNEQLDLVGGYDHTFCIDNADHTMREAAVAFDPVSGRKLTVLTDLPGVQFYTANNMEPCTGKDGAKYDKRDGFCLETGYFPNSANEKNFERPIFGPDKEYKTSTIYKFN